MALISITENISYLPATTKPLSSDVVFIKTNSSTWIFDAGMNSLSVKEINSIEGQKNIVISHFHPDHTFNLSRIKYDNLYVSSYTKRYTINGTIVHNSLLVEESPEISILEFPSSHAKGCLILVCGVYAFMGDGTYCREKIGNHTYNTQLLQQMIKMMEKLPVKYFCLSHAKNFIQDKDTVIQLYKDIYKLHQNNNPVINVESYFNSDGSVKDA